MRHASFVSSQSSRSMVLITWPIGVFIFICLIVASNGQQEHVLQELQIERVSYWFPVTVTDRNWWLWIILMLDEKQDDGPENKIKWTRTCYQTAENRTYEKNSGWASKAREIHRWTTSRVTNYKAILCRAVAGCMTHRCHHRETIGLILMARKLGINRFKCIATWPPAPPQLWNHSKYLPDSPSSVVKPFKYVAIACFYVCFFVVPGWNSHCHCSTNAKTLRLNQAKRTRRPVVLERPTRKSQLRLDGGLPLLPCRLTKTSCAGLTQTCCDRRSRCNCNCEPLRTQSADVNVIITNSKNRLPVTRLTLGWIRWQRTLRQITPLVRSSAKSETGTRPVALFHETNEIRHHDMCPC